MDKSSGKENTGAKREKEGGQHHLKRKKKKREVNTYCTTIKVHDDWSELVLVDNIREGNDCQCHLVPVELQYFCTFRITIVATHLFPVWLPAHNLKDE